MAKKSFSLIRDSRKIKLVYACITLVVVISGYTFWRFNPPSENFDMEIKANLINMTFTSIIALCGMYITGNVVQGIFTKPPTYYKPEENQNKPVVAPESESLGTESTTVADQTQNTFINETPRNP